MTIRVGFGYDVHRFSDDPDRRLMLGGVEIANHGGLDGHSDADVLLHATCDALLGAFALGDIGDHFPPDDDRWKNADSRRLTRLVLDLIPEGASVGNIDAVIVAERPLIKPHREPIRRSIADLLATDIQNVSVKATTNERLGAIGRSEGIVAMATVLLEVGE